jgi:hypothetical protein
MNLREECVGIITDNPVSSGNEGIVKPDSAAHGAD